MRRLEDDEVLSLTHFHSSSLYPPTPPLSTLIHPHLILRRPYSCTPYSSSFTFMHHHFILTHSHLQLFTFIHPHSSLTHSYSSTIIHPYWPSYILIKPPSVILIYSYLPSSTLIHPHLTLTHSYSYIVITLTCSHIQLQPHSYHFYTPSNGSSYPHLCFIFSSL